MVMYPTRYHRPKSLEEALQASCRQRRCVLSFRRAHAHSGAQAAAGAPLRSDRSRRCCRACSGIKLDKNVLSIGATTTHAEVAAFACRAQGHTGAGRHGWHASATAMSAIAARSAARSPTTIRRRIIPPPCSASARPSSLTGAALRPTISSSRSMRPRSNRARSSPVSISRFRIRPATPNSAVLRRVMRLPPCSLRNSARRPVLR